MLPPASSRLHQQYRMHHFSSWRPYENTSCVINTPNRPNFYSEIASLVDTPSWHTHDIHRRTKAESTQCRLSQKFWSQVSVLLWLVPGTGIVCHCKVKTVQGHVRGASHRPLYATVAPAYSLFSEFAAVSLEMCIVPPGHIWFREGQSWSPVLAVVLMIYLWEVVDGVLVRDDVWRRVRWLWSANVRN